MVRVGARMRQCACRRYVPEYEYPKDIYADSGSSYSLNSLMALRNSTPWVVFQDEGMTWLPSDEPPPKPKPEPLPHVWPRPRELDL